MTGRPPQPTALAKLKGADKHNPSRYKSRAKEPKPRQGIGQCPARLGDAAAAVWAEIESEIAAGVLTWQDRRAFGLLCQLFAEFDAAPSDFPGVKLGMVNSLLGQFGMTPSSRTRIRVVNDDPEVEANPFAEFANH